MLFILNYSFLHLSLPCFNVCLVPCSDVTAEMMSAVIQEIPLLIDESDLHIAQLTLRLLTLMLKHPSSKGIKPLIVSILPRVYSIVKSPLLQGTVTLLLMTQQL